MTHESESFAQLRIRGARVEQRADDVGIDLGRESCRYVGNALRDGDGTRGWFVGGFLDPGDHGLRATTIFECKWLACRKGDYHFSPGCPGRRTTVVILAAGRVRLSFGDGNVILGSPADYTIWTGGPPHTWIAETDSTVITLRAPSA